MFYLIANIALGRARSMEAFFHDENLCIKD